MKFYILVLCVSLVLLSTLTNLFSFWVSSTEFNTQQIQQDMHTAENVLQGHLKSKASLLLTAANVLTNDFGFKQAIRTEDKETIADTLNNHSARIRADLMILTELNGDLIAQARSQHSLTDVSFLKLVEQLLEKPGKVQFALIGTELYQILAIPVNTPRLSHFSLIGFRMDSAVLTELQHLSGMEVSFYSGNQALIISSAQTGATRFPNGVDFEASLDWLWLERPRFNNHTFAIDGAGPKNINVRLSKDLEPVYNDFNSMAFRSLWFALGILILAGLAGAWLSSRLTAPLARLCQTAREFAEGRYSSRIPDTNVALETHTLALAFQDMGAKIQEREYQILYQAQHDLLTGLLNRATFTEYLTHGLKTEKQQMLAAINIRSFKNVNDNFGSKTGDTCLKIFAERLQKMCDNKQGICARLGGDEFVFLQALPPEIDPTIEAQCLIDSLSPPFDAGELHLTLGFSVGICIYPQQATTASTLLRRSFIAMENARRGHQSFCCYVQGEDEAHQEKLEILESLKLALMANDKQLYLNYQPKMNLNNNRIDKVEALIRWRRPDGNFVSPELFVDLAEQSGLITDLTRWVIDHVLAQLKAWQDKGLTIKASINISAQDINHPNFIEYLLGKTEHYKIEPKLITVELTERDLMENEERAIGVLTKLRDKGFSLSVDDYGIGQSSLSKLKKLPIQELKIDKSFILKLASTPADQVIVKSTIAMGHNLDFSVVAEGVEDLDSLNILREMDCDYIQGYFLSRPQDPNDLFNWLGAYETRTKMA